MSRSITKQELACIDERIESERSLGGQQELTQRLADNLRLAHDWLERSPWNSSMPSGRQRGAKGHCGTQCLAVDHHEVHHPAQCECCVAVLLHADETPWLEAGLMQVVYAACQAKAQQQSSAPYEEQVEAFKRFCEEYRDTSLPTLLRPLSCPRRVAFCGRASHATKGRFTSLRRSQRLESADSIDVTLALVPNFAM